ncbi:MAG: acetyl-CoA carboxylase carboxyltransferase subunit alpha [Coriobacteriia bacterium]|nr:acetyl-CoA carboxylase carboxyltransferase subunit alpha [Coriobacteriia bacterium]
MAKPRYIMDFERPLIDLETKLADLRRLDLAENPELATEIEALAAEIDTLRIETYHHLSPWDRVQIARHPDRPKTVHYIEELFTDVVELHGDRTFADDEAMFAGFATIEGRRVALLGHRKGTNTGENIRRHFGSPSPEGFRKAMRVMRLAEKFHLPIVSLLDTPGAYPGPEAEERGQAWAIAESLELLSALRTPVICVGIGEGGSGGALAIGFGDRLFLLDNAYYSVSSPEACASIIYRDSSEAESASACLKMTAEDVVRLGIADEVLPEPLGGAHRNPAAVYDAVRVAITRSLDEFAAMPVDELVERRYQRLRAIGEYCLLDSE